jgi:hypothetical protein
MVQGPDQSDNSQGVPGGDSDQQDRIDLTVNLSQAAVAYWRSEASVTREQAARWDRQTRDHRETDDDSLPARGPDGDVLANVSRSAANADRHRTLARSETDQADQE